MISDVLYVYERYMISRVKLLWSSVKSVIDPRAATVNQTSSK